jgi:opacity protein-like surface antigen
MKRTGLVVTVLGFASLAHAQALPFEVRLGVAGVFPNTSTSSDSTRTLKPTSALAILGGFRWRFHARHSLELTIAHTTNSQIYTVPPDRFRIATTVNEYSGAYIFSPFTIGKFEPFVLGGAGALHFSPESTSINGSAASFGAASQTSLAYVYGGGTNYRLWRIFGLRLEYRGLIYKNPDFSINRLFTGTRGHMALPSVALVVKF